MRLDVSMDLARDGTNGSHQPFVGASNCRFPANLPMVQSRMLGDEQHQASSHTPSSTSSSLALQQQLLAEYTKSTVLTTTPARGMEQHGQIERSNISGTNVRSPAQDNKIRETFSPIEGADLSIITSPPTQEDESILMESPKSSSRSSVSPSFKDDSNSSTTTHSRNRGVHFEEGADPGNNHIDDRRLRRQIANCNERRRMQSINAGFQSLRQFLPQKGGEKMSKAAILQQTAELIQRLQMEKELNKHQTSNDSAVGTKTPPKKRRIEPEDLEPSKDHDISIYLKTIDDLKAALSREQQLRLVYEHELLEVQKKVVTNPMALDSSLLSLSELIRNNDALSSPQTSNDLPTMATLSPTPEINSKVLNVSPSLRNSVLSSLALQQQQQFLHRQLSGTLYGGQSTAPSPFTPSNVLNPSLLGHVVQQQQQFEDISRSLALNTRVTKPQSSAAISTTVQIAASEPSVRANILNLQSSLPIHEQQHRGVETNTNLNALFEAIRQLENANLSGTGSGLLHNASVNSSTAQSQHGQADLLVR